MSKLPARPFVSSTSVSGSLKKPRVFVEVIPRQLVDVVTKPFEQSPLSSREINDLLSYKTVNDAIISAKGVGFALLGHVIPENLFFFFGKTVKALQESFFEFNATHSIPYNSRDFYAPVHSNESNRCDESDAEPLAIVLCKLENTERLGQLLTTKKNNTAKNTNCYQISWSELQCLSDLPNIDHATELTREDGKEQHKQSKKRENNP